MNGAELIAGERQRQIEVEGWTRKHDDEHFDGALAYAAASYTLSTIGHPQLAENLWPWDESWWKPTPQDRTRSLVKAGALIAAEIDRLMRLNGGNDATS